MPELKKSILTFAYRINFKYEGMLAYSFDWFCVVTKIILPSVNNLKFLPDERCNYLNDDLVHDHNTKEYMSNLKVCYRKIVPFMNSYKEQISSYNQTSHNLLMDEISLILPNFPKSKEEKQSIIALLITGFIGLVYGSYI